MSRNGEQIASFNSLNCNLCSELFRRADNTIGAVSQPNPVNSCLPEFV